MSSTISADLAQKFLVSSRDALKGGEFRDAVNTWDELREVRGALNAIPDVSIRQDMANAFQYLFLVVFPVLSDTEALQGLSENIALALSESNYNLIEKVRHKLLGIEIIEDRDDYRRKMRDLLLRSGSEITEMTPGNRAGDVQAWLQDYITANPQRDNLKRAEYITHLRQSKLVGEEDLLKVERLIKLFEYLELSSAAEGFEEDGLLDLDGKIVSLEEGRVIITDPAEDQFLSKDVKKFTDGMKKARALSASNPGPLEKQAREYLKNNSMDAAAALDILGKLMLREGGIVTPEQAVAAVMAAFSSMSVEDVLGETGAGSLMDLFTTVLGKVMKLNPDMVAAIAARVIGSLKSQDRNNYRHEVYYDMSAGKFVWGDPVIIPID